MVSGAWKLLAIVLRELKSTIVYFSAGRLALVSTFIFVASGSAVMLYARDDLVFPPTDWLGWMYCILIFAMLMHVLMGHQLLKSLAAMYAVVTVGMFGTIITQIVLVCVFVSQWTAPVPFLFVVFMCVLLLWLFNCAYTFAKWHESGNHILLAANIAMDLDVDHAQIYTIVKYLHSFPDDWLQEQVSAEAERRGRLLSNAEAKLVRRTFVKKLSASLSINEK